MSRFLRRAQISGSSLRHMYQQITINLLTENIGEDLMGQGIVNLKKDFPEQLTEISSSQIGCHLKFTNSNNNGRGEAKSPPFPAKRKYIFTQRNVTLIFGLTLLRLLNFYFFLGNAYPANVQPAARHCCRGVSRTAGSHERKLYSQAIERDTRVYLPGGNVGVTELDTTIEDELGDTTEGTTTKNKLDDEGAF